MRSRLIPVGAAANAVAGVVRQANKAGVSVWIAGTSAPVRKASEAHGVHARFAATAAARAS